MILQKCPHCDSLCLRTCPINSIFMSSSCRMLSSVLFFNPAYMGFILCQSHISIDVILLCYWGINGLWLGHAQVCASLHGSWLYAPGKWCLFIASWCNIPWDLSLASVRSHLLFETQIKCARLCITSGVMQDCLNSFIRWADFWQLQITEHHGRVLSFGKALFQRKSFVRPPLEYCSIMWNPFIHANYYLGMTD